MSGTSKSQELGSKVGSNATDVVSRIGLSAELTIRLWAPSPTRNRLQSLSWKSDYTPVHLISDLLVACDGILLPDIQDRLTASFESLQDAVAAAKRIQWALLGYFQDQPAQAVAAAIFVDTSAGERAQKSPGPVLSSLAVAEPAQILVAETVYERLNGVPGMEFRNFGTQSGICELVWAPPETYRVWKQALNQPLESTAASAEDPLSSTRLLQLSGTSVDFVEELAPQHSTVRGVISEPSSFAEPFKADLLPPDTDAQIIDTTEASHSQSNVSWIDFRSTRFRRALLATAGVVAILVVALIGVIVHKKNEAAHHTARQTSETGKLAAVGSVVPSTTPVSQPSDKSLTHSAVDTSLVARQPVESASPAGRKDDSSRSRKSRAIADVEGSNNSESVATEPVASGKCHLLTNEISAYLDIADKNRAGGNYDDAAREYRAVIECDRRNARAQQGLVRIKQARAVSQTDSSEDSR